MKTIRLIIALEPGVRNSALYRQSLTLFSLVSIFDCNRSLEPFGSSTNSFTLSHEKQVHLLCLPLLLKTIILKRGIVVLRLSRRLCLVVIETGQQKIWWCLRRRPWLSEPGLERDSLLRSIGSRPAESRWRIFVSMLTTSAITSKVQVATPVPRRVQRRSRVVARPGHNGIESFRLIKAGMWRVLAQPLFFWWLTTWGDGQSKLLVKEGFKLRNGQAGVHRIESPSTSRQLKFTKEGCGFSVRCSERQVSISKPALHCSSRYLLSQTGTDKVSLSVQKKPMDGKSYLWTNNWINCVTESVMICCNQQLVPKELH